MFNQTANAPQNASPGGIGEGSAVSMLIPIETLVRDVIGIVIGAIAIGATVIGVNSVLKGDPDLWIGIKRWRKWRKTPSPPQKRLTTPLPSGEALEGTIDLAQQDNAKKSEGSRK